MHRSNHGNIRTKRQHHKTFHFGIVYPVSTNGRQATKYTNKVSLNVLWDISMNEQAFVRGGLGNNIRGNDTGMQLAGLVNAVEGEGQGFTLAGLTHLTGNKYSEVQLAGVANVVGSNITGFQLSSLANISENMKGFADSSSKCEFLPCCVRVV